MIIIRRRRKTFSDSFNDSLESSHPADRHTDTQTDTQTHKQTDMQGMGWVQKTREAYLCLYIPEIIPKIDQ